MIVKILRKSETFKGVNYNSRKVDKDKGELMQVSGFGALQGMDNLRPSDYISYLEALSSKSSRTEFPQLHVSISCKGQSHTKQQLTKIASEWMKGMGYGTQPYIVVFHNDTANAHVHIVSTRVDRSGKKINDSFERLRAYQVLNQIMARDPTEQFAKDTAEALAYRFSTRPQFAMLLEGKGYQLALRGEQYHLYKFGKCQGKMSLQTVDQRIASYEKDHVRVKQLRAIIEKYRLLHSGEVFPVSRPLPGGVAGPAYAYSSDLAQVLQQKFGIQILYHGAPGKPPYGFSVLDHQSKMVLKGKELMEIRELITKLAVKTQPNPLETTVSNAGCIDIYSFPKTYSPGNRLPEDQQADLPYTGDSDTRSDDFTGGTFSSLLADLQLDISDDVDDEQILGPTRRRKRKARTNTR